MPVILVLGLAVLASAFYASDPQPSDKSSIRADAAVSDNVLGQVLPPDQQAELVRLIQAAYLSELRWPDFSDYSDQVLTFSEAGSYAVAWLRNGELTPQALALIRSFQAAPEKGLNAEDYDGPRWDARLAQLKASSNNSLLHFDLALTVCTMRYVSDLHMGRINPRHFQFGIDVGPKRYDLTEFLRNEVVYSPDPDKAVASVEPRYEGYARLKTALVTYLKLAAAGDSEPVPLPVRTLRPGDTYRGMPQLVNRLEQLGDMPPDSESKLAGSSFIYQGAIVEGVRHFQRRHGLEPDGLIGSHTAAEVNTPLRDRVEQLQFALERYRWIPDTFPQPPIVVNIPEFRLRTTARFSSAARHGDHRRKAYHHQTPVFIGYMRYVIFRP